ncbi:MAG: hypothetical protein OXI53_11995 [Nitrospira sp.]|nr:hypothetical protein [Nitrospira sp.]MDE0406018.1 hypothetical protein [Nitrospira sp.]
MIKYISLALIETKQDSLQRHGRAFACVDLAPEQFQKMWHDRILDMQPSRQEFFTAPSDDVPMSLALAP